MGLLHRGIAYRPSGKAQRDRQFDMVIGMEERAGVVAGHGSGLWALPDSSGRCGWGHQGFYAGGAASRAVSAQASALQPQRRALALGESAAAEEDFAAATNIEGVETVRAP
jgi:hypothetical protein